MSEQELVHPETRRSYKIIYQRGTEIPKAAKAIYRLVRKIPRGRVATYGQIATLAGIDGHARQVGYALHALPSGSDVPWHRVINARGEISPRNASDSHELQRLLLEAEGVEFDARGRVNLAIFGIRDS